MSVESFCLKHKVPYNLFNKWYKDTRKKVVSVQVSDMPPEAVREKSSVEESGTPSVPSTRRIMIDIRVDNGLHIHQRNLSYQSLRALVDKLECLC